MMEEFDETCSSVSSEMELPELLPTNEENEDFVFETDSYALQNNKDYQDLLNCLFRLESQRIYVTKVIGFIFIPFLNLLVNNNLT